MQINVLKVVLSYCIFIWVSSQDAVNVAESSFRIIQAPSVLLHQNKPPNHSSGCPRMSAYILGGKTH